MRYFAYVRKSTEGKERQALSISSQIDKAKEIFGNLDIVDVLEEKHSAFKPYQRPVFEDMIKQIKKGKADGIIAWHPDRLSRNEIDASTITYLVRTGVIKDLKFGSYNFDNSPEGIMMLQLALSQSQYFSSKLGKDVRRGMEKKFEMGWHPNMPPSGYINVRKNGFSTIKKDKKRFRLIRQAFNLMLTGNHSVPQILDKLNNEWNFKTKRKKKGLTRSSLYRMFTNLFYTGIIEYNGRQKMGKHKPMITLDEYDRIQVLLGKKGKPRQRVNKFAYSGLIRCDNCGSLISADKKTKIIKTTGEEKTFVYYRCNRKKPSIPCSEKAISLPSLEEQIDEMLLQYDVIPEFAELFDEIVKDCRKDDHISHEEVLNNIKNDISKVKQEKNNLTKLICKNLITEDEFVEQKNSYKKQILKLEQKVKEVTRGKNESEDVLDNISIMMRARKRFQRGDIEVKKSIVSNLGSNRVLRDRMLLISANKWSGIFELSVQPYAQEYATLELHKKPLTKTKNELLNSLCCELRTGRDSNPQLLP